MTASVQRLPQVSGKNQTVATVSDELLSLAGEINTYLASGEAMLKSSIIHYAKAGRALIEAKQQCENFSEYLNQYCRVKRSQAYKYMRLAREMPELLDDSVQSTGRYLNLEQANALLTAPEEVKEQVAEHLEEGENVTVNEINRLKKEAKELKESNDFLKKTNKIYTNDLMSYRDQLSTSKEQQKKEIDAEVKAKLKIEKATLQEEVDKLVAIVGNDYEAKINTQTDKISELRNKLANPDAGKLAEIKQEIIDAEQQLREIEQKRIHAEYDDIFCGKLKHLMNAYLGVSTALLSRPEQHQYYPETLKFIQHSHNSLNSFVNDLSDQLEGQS